MAEKGKFDDLLQRLTPFLLVATIVLAFFVGVLWTKLTKFDNQEKVAGEMAAPREYQPYEKLSEEVAAKLPMVNDDDNIRGSREARVFLIEYSDFECPFCVTFHQTAIQAVEEFDGEVAWVYRHFPLDMIHADARSYAEASECAAELGGKDAFWQFADMIFETLPDVNIQTIASQIGLNSVQFNSCVESGWKV